MVLFHRTNPSRTLDKMPISTSVCTTGFTETVKNCFWRILFYIWRYRKYRYFGIKNRYFRYNKSTWIEVYNILIIDSIILTKYCSIHIERLKRHTTKTQVKSSDFLTNNIILLTFLAEMHFIRVFQVDLLIFVKIKKN